MASAHYGILRVACNAERPDLQQLKKDYDHFCERLNARDFFSHDPQIRYSHAYISHGQTDNKNLDNHIYIRGEGVGREKVCNIHMHNMHRQISSRVRQSLQAMAYRLDEMKVYLVKFFLFNF